ncbi:alpha/beta hydrolase, partial [Nocardioides sp.]|uniref:alpha/beta hydrolase n=1 Tax=Nocardioides sp. TaxID=35761 RepID=UPI00356B45DC
MDLEVITKRAENPRGAAPLLFVHGAWHGAWCWENFTDYFSARGYDCWALSLRGHGGSAATPLRFTGPRLHHYLDDIATVARTLPAPPVLLGHSMGGALVQLYLAESAATHPAAAAGLLASMPPSGVLKVTLKVARTKPGTFAAANLTGDLGRLVGTPELVRTLFLSEGVSPDLLHRVAAQVGP